MRRTLAVVLSAGLLLVWSFCQDLSLQAQLAPGAPTENGDVNGDGKRDIADAVSLLTWMFEGGPEPVPLACADPVDLGARVSALEEWRGSREFGRGVAGTYFVNYDFGDLRWKGFLTLTADGSVLMAMQTQYGYLTPAAYQSVLQGRWKKTGDFQITADTHFLNFEEDRMPRKPPGADVVVISWVLDIDEGTRQLSGKTVDWDGWKQDQIPFEDPPNTGGGGGTITLTARFVSG